MEQVLPETAKSVADHQMLPGDTSVRESNLDPVVDYQSRARVVGFDCVGES